MSYFLGQYKVKSRKTHRCFFCAEKIEPGQIYILREGVDGRFWRMKMHPECEKANEKMDDMEFECFSIGSLKRGTSEEKQ